jgi:hypothetical protein
MRDNNRWEADMDAQGGTITDVKDLLPIMYERSSAATTLWNIELALILGIVAALATEGTLANHAFIQSLITAMLFMVTFFNFRGLIEISLQRYILRDLFYRITTDDILKRSVTDQYLRITALTITPPCVISLALFGAFAAATAFIWLYPWLASHAQAAPCSNLKVVL